MATSLIFPVIQDIYRLVQLLADNPLRPYVTLDLPEKYYNSLLNELKETTDVSPKPKAVLSLFGIAITKQRLALTKQQEFPF
jgi:hypothetical protein